MQVCSHLQYQFVCFYLIFGLFLADVLPFSFLDEVIEVLFLFQLISRKLKIKEFNCFIGFIIFELFYSILISSNFLTAILLDALQQMKPFVYFYYSYYLLKELTVYEKKKIRRLSMIMAFLSFFIGTALDPSYSSGLFKHPTNYGMTMFTYALIYFYYSDFTKKEIICFILIASLGLLCGRSKYYGYYVCSMAIVFFVDRIKLSFKYVLLISLTVSVMYVVTQDKIMAYTNDDAMETQARTVLYLNTLPIIVDYLPFGSGFSSYATWFSGVFYSRIYSKYGIDSVYGLENPNGDPESVNFIADTYFPCIAQIGVFGVVIFTLFWKRRMIEVNKIYNYDIRLYKIGVIIMIYVFIESLASPMIVTSYSLLPMLILGKITSRNRFNFAK